MTSIDSVTMASSDSVTINSSNSLTMTSSNSVTMAPSKHKSLTLEEKIKLIEEHEKNKRRAKELSVLFEVGKTQIYDILKKKNKYKDEWLNGRAAHVKRLSKSTGYDEINRCMFEWFVGARARGIPISGPLLKSEALEIAKKLDKPNFKASNGWLESFKHRHNIVFNAVCGEDIVTEYEPRNVYKCDEADLFFRLSPTDALTVRESKRTRSRRSKERLTVFLSPSMIGEMENTEDIQSAPAEMNSCDEAIEETDEEGQSNERELKIRTYGEALSVVNELQVFAASKNIPELLELLQDAQTIIQHSLVKKKSRKSSLKDTCED